MNEFIFFSHALIIMVFIKIALHRGKIALVAISALQCILANLFVLKTVSLFGLTVTPSDAYTIGCMISINLLREFFGKKIAKEVIFLNVFFTLFFVAMSLVQVYYLPHKGDFMHSHYAAILTPSLRILSASLISFFVSQVIDYRIYANFRKHISLRSSMILSLLISQLIDTTLFSFLGLYGLVDRIDHIIFFSYAIKVITLLFMGFLTKPLLAYKGTPHAKSS